MRKSNLITLLLTTAFCGCLFDVSAFATNATLTHSKIVDITESVSSGGGINLNASIGAPVNIGGVSTNSGTAQTVANFSGMVQPVYAPGTYNYSSPSQAVNAIGQLVRYEIAQFSNRVASLMRPNKPLSGATQAVFTYTVSVKITGKGKPVRGFVNDTCFIVPSGAHSCIGAKYNSNVTKVIYAEYQQGAIAQGLPSSWRLPDPGQFKWAELEIQKSGSGVTQSFIKVRGKTWHRDNLLRNGGPLGQYGLYDMYQVATVSGHQILVNCGAASNTACTQYAAGQSVPDPNNAQGVGRLQYRQKTPVTMLAKQYIAPLEKKYGASNAVLLYGETVKPVYTPGKNGTENAVTAIDIQQRVIVPGGMFFFIAKGGNGQFNESGDYGYLLNQQMDQYSVDASGNVTLDNVFDKHVVSPTKSFSKSVSLSGRSRPTGPDIINPFKTGNQIYSYLNDTVNHLPPSAYIHVAPIRVQ